MLEQTTRRIALLGPAGDWRIPVHTSGYPMSADQLLPDADVVLLVGNAKDGAMLFRYSAHGELCGDTPHSSVAEAEQEAVAEFGEALFPWVDVPADIVDAHAFAIDYAADRLDERP